MKNLLNIFKKKTNMSKDSDTVSPLEEYLDTNYNKSGAKPLRKLQITDDGANVVWESCVKLNKYAFLIHL